MTFQVGKKYRYRPTPVQMYECLFVGETVALLKNIVYGNEFVALKSDSSMYEEYHEPRVVETVRDVHADGEGIWLSTRDSKYIVGRIKIKHTEGKGLSVEILEG